MENVQHITLVFSKSEYICWNIYVYVVAIISNWIYDAPYSRSAAWLLISALFSHLRICLADVLLPLRLNRIDQFVFFISFSAAKRHLSCRLYVICRYIIEVVKQFCGFLKINPLLGHGVYAMLWIRLDCGVCNKTM